MRFGPWKPFWRLKKGGRSGFTLAEVLAALAFMAIVIPVAMQGVRVASLAGQASMQKKTAARIAEAVLNETIVTGEVQNAGASGTVIADGRAYRWTVRHEPWAFGAMTLVTVHVVFPVQDLELDVELSTLADFSNG